MGEINIKPEAVNSVALGDVEVDLWATTREPIDSYLKEIEKRWDESFDFLGNLLEIVPSDGTIVDFGATFGDFALYFVTRGFYAHLFDFDPTLLNVAAINFVLNNTAGRADFNLLPRTDGVCYPPVGDDFQSEVQSIISSCRVASPRETPSIDSLGLEVVDLIRFNVPGHERGLLQGSQQTIQRCRPVLLFEDADTGDTTFLADWAEQNNYFLRMAESPRLLFTPVEKTTQDDLIQGSTSFLRNSQSDAKVEEERRSIQLGVMLRTLRQLAHARAGVIRQLNAEITGLEDQVEQQQARMLAQENAWKNTENNFVKEIEEARETESILREKLLLLRSSKTYQLGSALRDGLGSTSGFFKVPGRLLSLRKNKSESADRQPGQLLDNEKTSTESTAVDQ